jgi:hypothetical protein
MEADMKKTFIAVGLAIVATLMFMDWANYEHHLKEKREAILAGTYDGK